MSTEIGDGSVELVVGNAAVPSLDSERSVVGLNDRCGPSEGFGGGIAGRGGQAVAEHVRDNDEAFCRVQARPLTAQPLILPMAGGV